MTLTRSLISRRPLLLLFAAGAFSAGLVIGLDAQAPPGAPSGLTASIDGTTATLLWQPSAAGGATDRYVIEAGSTPGASDLGRFYTGSPATTIVATNLAAGTYYVRIRGVNSAGESAPSNEASLTIGAVCAATPQAPGPLVSSVSGSSVRLSWGASSGAVSTYVFEIGSFAGGTNLGTIELGTTATSYLATGVAGGTYFVRVKARNSCGLSAASNDTTVIVGSAPSGPAQLQIVNAQEYTVQGGPRAGELMVAGEVVNTGGTVASMVHVGVEVFSPTGSRLFGTTGAIVGRSRRLVDSRVESWTLGPGETGCFWKSLGPANRVGRYALAIDIVESFPTTELQGQAQATVTWAQGGGQLVVSSSMTNRGTIPIAWNRVAFVVKDSGGRVLACGSTQVFGRQNAHVPLYGVTNVLQPGETGFPSSSMTLDAVNPASVASVSAWPQWKE